MLLTVAHFDFPDQAQEGCDACGCLSRLHD
jgi:hypothetical protein